MESIVQEEQELFEPSFSERFAMITNYFNFYYTPLLCLFGGFGNCVSLYIFCSSPSHRHLSSSYYLSALAIADTGFLINVIALWITTGLGYNVVTTTISCPLAIYLSQVSCFLSVWLVVAFTVERFFAVCYPLTRPTVCTVARAKRVIFAITCFALIAFSYAWVIAQVVQLPEDDEDFGSVNSTNWISTEPPSIYGQGEHENGPDEEFMAVSAEEESNAPLINGESHNQKQTFQGEEQQLMSSSNSNELSFNTSDPSEQYSALFCTVPKKYHDFSRYANYVDSFFTLILPFCIITGLNIRITLCVWKLKGQRENIVAVAKFKSSSSPNLNQNCVINVQSELVPRNTLRFQNSANTSNSTSPTVNVNIETTVMGETMLQHQSDSQLCSPAVDNLKCSPNKVYTPSTMRKLASHQTQSHSNAAEVRVTKTLLLVSTVFLVLNLPSHAMRMAAFIQEAFWPDSLNHGIDLSAFHQWAYILFNTNFGVNFLLYCASGRNFRTALYNLLCCTNRRNSRRSGHGSGPGGGRGHKRKSNYIRNTARRPQGGQKRSVSLRRRVWQSFTRCPGSILGIETNRRRKSGQINLRNVNGAVAADNRSDNFDNTSTYGGGGEEDRRSSIQSTTFITTFNNSEFTL